MESFVSYFSINPGIRFGKPCIKGTRIVVTDILQWLASDMTHEEILSSGHSIKKWDCRTTNG
ncbi:MAG: DUF433 domain-containing protein [Tannerellaceae bacterium]|nr:DUF433 domain-containing protein [Tannerellaceae bacterium]